MKCFSYFVAKTTKKRNSIVNRQVFYIFAIHLMCYAKLFIWRQNVKFLIIYGVSIVSSILSLIPREVSPKPMVSRNTILPVSGLLNSQEITASLTAR